MPCSLDGDGDVCRTCGKANATLILVQELHAHLVFGGHIEEVSLLTHLGGASRDAEFIGYTHQQIGGQKGRGDPNIFGQSSQIS